MKYSMLVTVLACILLGAAAAEKPSSTQPATTQPANKFCPIETEHEIDPKVTTVYKDKTIGFCCEDCIPTFKKDPEKYAKNLK